MGNYLLGEVEKCESCNGRGFSGSENHPDCYACNGCGYVEVSNKEDVHEQAMQ